MNTINLFTLWAIISSVIGTERREAIEISLKDFKNIEREIESQGIVANQIKSCKRYKKIFNKMRTLLFRKSEATVRPEICEWGLSEDANLPAHICNVTAIIITKEWSHLVVESRETLIWREIEPYEECLNMIVQNEEKVTRKVIYCPPLIIKISETEEKYVNGFLIGESDRARLNSINAYDFDTNNNAIINPLYYVINVLISQPIKIPYKKYRKIVKDGNKRLKMYDSTVAESALFIYRENIENEKNANLIYNVLCNLPLNEKIDLCTNFAAIKWYSIDSYIQCSKPIDTIVDKSSIVPYKCANRFVTNISEKHGRYFSEIMIYCPTQIFVMKDNSLYQQKGFFFSPGDIMVKSVILYNTLYLDDEQDGYIQIDIWLKSYITWKHIGFHGEIKIKSDDVDERAEKLKN